GLKEKQCRGSSSLLQDPQLRGAWLHRNQSSNPWFVCLSRRLDSLWGGLQVSLVILRLSPHEVVAAGYPIGLGGKWDISPLSNPAYSSCAHRGCVGLTSRRTGQGRCFQEECGSCPLSPNRL